MNLHDQVPILIFHVFEGNVPENPGIVYKYINATKVVDGGLNDSFTILNTIIVSGSFAASSADLLNNYVGSLQKCYVRPSCQAPLLCYIPCGRHLLL